MVKDWGEKIWNWGECHFCSNYSACAVEMRAEGASFVLLLFVIGLGSPCPFFFFNLLQPQNISGRFCNAHWRLFWGSTKYSDSKSLWQASSGTSSLRWTKTKLALAVHVRLPDIRMTLQQHQEQRIRAAPERPSPQVTARESQRDRPVRVFPSREVRSCGFLSNIWSLPSLDTMYQLGVLFMNRKGTAHSTVGTPTYLVLKTGKARVSELRPKGASVG